MGICEGGGYFEIGARGDVLNVGSLVPEHVMVLDCSSPCSRLW